MATKILIIDDDKTVLEIANRYLKKAGYQTLTLSDSTKAMTKINTFKPDVIVVDLMMPQIDGFHLIKEIRDKKKYNHIKIVVISSKSFEFDKDQSYKMGAQAFLKKPLEQKNMLETLARIIKDEIKVTFWGTRGTISKPGQKTLKYGGNTSCVSVELTKDRLFIFDAGSGITELGRHMASQNRRYKINLFITHPHWDHINGFPFFIPVYQQGNEMVVHGSSHGNISLREVISNQMESIYFPVTIKEFASRVYFKEILEGEYEVEGLTIQAIMLNHPGIALGYRLTSKSGKSLAYITDNELVPKESGNNEHFRKKLVKFLKNVDLLIHDSSYFDEEYKKRVGWGHPPISELMRLAKDAKVKSVCLFHHDPDHDDKKIKEKETFAKRYLKERNLKIKCFAAVEGSTVCL